MKKFIFILTFAIITIWGKSQNVENVAYQDNTVRFTVITDGLIRMEYSETGQFVDAKSFIAINRENEDVNFKVKKGKNVVITTPKLTLKYRVNSGTFTAKNLSITANKSLATPFKWTPGMVQQHNLKGTYRTLDGYDGDYNVDDSIVMPIEDGLLATDGWTLIDDSKGLLFDNSEWEWVEERKNDGVDWYFMAYGHDYKQALRDFTVLSGRVPLPPRYAFGYWWSKYWSYSDKEIRQMVKHFEQYDIPLDVMVIDMDWHYTEKGRGAWTGWTWNKKLFPDYPRLLAWLHEKGIKSTLNLHPAQGFRTYEEKYEELFKFMGFNDTLKRLSIPWISSRKLFMEGVFNVVLRPMEKNGVDFWWLDWQQQPFDRDIKSLSNTWWLNYTFFTDFERNRNTRPMLYHRWGGLGNHRYQVGFSGDAKISWKSLDFQPYFNSTASNVLYGYWSHDLGGHWGGKIEPELYTRWMLFGLYSPIMRTHSTKDALITKEPWLLPSEYTEIIINTIHQRYEPVPYTYTMARKTTDEGLSLCRPLYYDYPENKEAYDFRNEYMFGDNLLVAPITEPMNGTYSETKIWLPKGQWYDLATGEMIEGGSVITRYYQIDEYPVFAKAGTILPRYTDYHQRLDDKQHQYVMEIVPGTDGEFTLYDDANNDKNYLNQYTTTKMTMHKENHVVTVTIDPRQGSYEGMTQEREIMIRLLSSDTPKSVKINGVESQWSYNGNRFAVEIELPKSNWNEQCIMVVTYDDNELYLADGIEGLARRAGKAMTALKYRDDHIVLKDELGLFGSIGEKITYTPETLRESVEQFREYIAKIEETLNNQNLNEENKTWLKAELNIK